MALYETLQQAAQTPTAVHRPTLFRLPADTDALTALMASGSVLEVHDTMAEQVSDYVKACHPTASEAERAAMVAKTAPGPLEEHGAWAFYPWSGRLVHVLPKDQFRSLRSDRNQYLILPDEQLSLAERTVGVVGLSVGQSIAICLAMEGVGGHFLLADPDHLDFSNLNRICGGVHEVGLAKTVMAARKMTEMDPYLQIDIHPEGLNDANIDAFMDALDLVIEECDDLIIKLKVREAAKARQIPVLMATSDRGMIDVERFDRQPDRPILHGLLGAVDSSAMAALPPPERLVFIETLANLNTASARTIASMLEIKSSISTWPQLASSVVMGAGALTHLARKILTEGDTSTVPSGRFLADLDALVSPEAALELTIPERVEPVNRDPLAPLPPAPVTIVQASPEFVRAMVERAGLAPSASNTQPWRFTWNQGTLWCSHDPALHNNLLDPHARADRLAIGAAIENIGLTASAVGWSTRVETIEPHRWKLTFDQDNSPADPLYAHIDERCTERYLGPRIPLDPAVAEAMQDQATRSGGQVLLHTSDEALAEVGAIQSEIAKLAMLGPTLYKKMMEEFRWTTAEAVQTLSGQDLEASDLPEPAKVILRLLRNRPAIDVLRDLGVGESLGQVADHWMAGASAALMIRAPRAWWDGIEAGRLMQRVWLQAVSQGWALQPLGWSSFMLDRVRDGVEDVEQNRSRLEALNHRWVELWPHDPDQRDVFFFRVIKTRETRPRSLRLNVDDILTIVP